MLLEVVAIVLEVLAEADEEVITEVEMVEVLDDVEGDTIGFVLIVVV